MATVSGKNSHKLSRTEIIQLVEELQENQANLQAQNAELRSKVQSKERHLKKYAEFYDFAPIGYLSLEENGIIRDINLTVCELLGEDRQNLKNRTVLDFIHEDDKQIFSDHMKRLFRTRGSDICHIKVKYKEKCYFIELRGIAVEDEDTGRLYCRCSMFNISDRVEAETELEEQRKLMEAVFEHIESSIIVCDQKGDLSFLNKAATNLFGHNQIGHQSEDWTKNLNLYREDGETLLEIEEMPLYKAWKGKKVKNEEVHIVAEGGDMRTLLASGQPIYDKQGT
ncbi:MAG: PAS domain S-box protein, partial [Balneolales bacterium]